MDYCRNRGRPQLSQGDVSGIAHLYPQMCKVQPFYNGQIVRFYSLGGLTGDRYLNGLTASASVNLAPTFEGVHTGASWKVHALPNGNYAFESLGSINGPRFLDGLTDSGQVGLAPAYAGVFTGANWEVYDASGSARQGVYMLRSLGAKDGPRWLDAQTAEGSVQLRAAITGVFTGTKWLVKQIVPLTALLLPSLPHCLDQTDWNTHFLHHPGPQYRKSIPWITVLRESGTWQ